MKKTGWPPGLLQDDCSKLSRWFASRIDARETVRRVFRQEKGQDMTQDEIIDMARQADVWVAGQEPYQSQLEAFAKLIAEREREACAKLIEVPDDVEDWEIICGEEGRYLLNAMADAIRARGRA